MDQDPQEATPADALIAWYDRHTRQARHGYQWSELALLTTAAAIPVSTVLSDESWPPAVLGAVVVVLTGLRRIFGFHENWIRFADARVQLESERALFRHRLPPYDGDEAVAVLIGRLREIETSETRSWSDLRQSQQSAR